MEPSSSRIQAGLVTTEPRWEFLEVHIQFKIFLKTDLAVLMFVWSDFWRRCQYFSLRFKVGKQGTVSIWLELPRKYFLFIFGFPCQEIDVVSRMELW